MKLFRQALGLVLLLPLLNGVAVANVTVAATRVVFPGGNREITLRLSNHGDTPSLMEAWIDSGDLHSTPDTASAPFMMTPPLFRIDAHRDQNLRILRLPHVFPADRESLFWLNVLEIPAKPAVARQGGNYLQFALRSRLKLFYRPKGLTGTAEKAPAALVWHPGRAGGVSVSNPTGYYVTIIAWSARVAGQAVAGVPAMLAPFSVLKLDFQGRATQVQAGTAVQFETVNDYGGVDHYQAELGP